MSDITTFQNDIRARLLSKKTLLGVTILTVDDHDILNSVQRAIARLGTAAIIGTPKGSNDSPDSPGIQQTLNLMVVVMENVPLNRGRSIAATVANEAERLALAGTVQLGQIVEQTDIGDGIFRVAYEGNVSKEIDLSLDATVNFVRDALNAMDSIGEQGDVTVTGSLAEGYMVTWNENGPRAMLQLIKGGEFLPGTVIRVSRIQEGIVTDPPDIVDVPEVQQILIRRWYWLVAGTGANPTNWGLFMVASEILQLVMRSLHRFSPALNQAVVSRRFDYGPREDVVDIQAQFTIRMFLDASPVP